MRPLKELENAIGKAVADLSLVELSSVIDVLTRIRALRTYDVGPLLEAMAHPSWAKSKVRPRNALLLLSPRPQSTRGRKAIEQVSVDGIRTMIDLGLSLGATTRKEALRRALKAYFRDTNRHRTERFIEQMATRLQKREIAGR